MRILSIFILLLFVPMDLTAQHDEKTIAYRLAREEAVRRLVEKVESIVVSSPRGSSWNPRIRFSLHEFVLRHAKEIAPPVYRAEKCEVSREISWQEMVDWLQEALKSSHFPLELKRPFVPEGNEAPQTIQATGIGIVVARGKENIWERATPKGRTLALRSAKIDAYRNLAEVVKGIRLDAHTQLRDFINENDGIRTEFIELIRNARFNEPDYPPDGTVEIQARIEMEKIVHFFSSSSRRYECSKRWDPHCLNEARKSLPELVHALGTGILPPQHIQSKASSPANRASLPYWVNQRMYVTGTGAVASKNQPVAQARLLAKRAAQMDGYRQLMEKIKGLSLKGETKIENFAATYDKVEGKIEATLRGAKIESVFYREDGTVEVSMSLELMEIWRIVNDESPR